MFIKEENNSNKFNNNNNNNNNSNCENDNNCHILLIPCNIKSGVYTYISYTYIKSCL